MAYEDQESIALDPSEFVDDREELPFDELGLYVRSSGADWGEAAVEAFFVEQQFGSAPVGDPTVPNVEFQVPIRVREDGSVSLAEAAHKLQQKVSTSQQPRGGWLRRDFDDGGGFSGSVGCQIWTPALSGLQGWLFAHRQDGPEVWLKGVRSPYWYATVEIEGDPVTVTDAREITGEIANMLGSGPGLIRLRVENEGEEPWRGIIVPVECRDHPQDESAETTAAPAYACEDLTLMGGSTVQTYSEDTVVENTDLTVGWLTILGSEIDGVGHMTHRGPRRIRFRAYDPGDEPGDVQLRIESRLLGALNWSPNVAVSVPLVDGFVDLDVGEARPHKAILGDDRWEFRAQARAASGAGAIRLHRVRLESCEQRVMVRTQDVAAAADQVEEQLPGTVVSDGAVGTLAWSNPGNAKASDSSRAVAKVSGVSLNQITEYLAASDFGFGLPEGARVVDVSVAVERRQKTFFKNPQVHDSGVHLIVGGVVLDAYNGAKPDIWPESDGTALYSGAGPGAKSFWGLDELLAADTNASDFGVAVSAQFGTDTGHEAEVNTIAIGLYYTEAEDENRVCFAGRSIEFRSDGVYRQHPTDDVWGYVPAFEGFHLVAPEGGMEERTMRWMVVPSTGDFEALEDAGSHSATVTPLYRPGYLFAREAL